MSFGLDLAIGGGLALADSLFGSDDPAPGAGAPQFNPIVAPFVQSQLDRTADTTRDVFSGDRVAGFNPLQQGGLDLAQVLAQSAGDQQGAVGGAFTNFASGANIGQNPFLEDALAANRDVAFTNFTRNQLPAIRNNAVAAGGTGGSRQGIAEGVALGDLNRDLIASEAGLRSNQVNQDISNQLQALIQQGNILSGQTSPMDILLRTGGLQQGQQQREIDATRQEFEEGQDLQFNRDLDLLRILLGSQQTPTPVANQTNPLNTFLGGTLLSNQLFSGGNPITGGAGATNTNNPASSFFSAPTFP